MERIGESKRGNEVLLSRFGSYVLVDSIRRALDAASGFRRHLVRSLGLPDGSFPMVDSVFKRSGVTY